MTSLLMIPIRLVIVSYDSLPIECYQQLIAVHQALNTLFAVSGDHSDEGAYDGPTDYEVLVQEDVQRRMC